MSIAVERSEFLQAEESAMSEKLSKVVTRPYNCGYCFPFNAAHVVASLPSGSTESVPMVYRK